MIISNPISIYLHIPFCSKRCGYCDFTTYAGKESLIPAYVDSLCKEIKIVTDLKNEKTPIKTIFFGGGTPSLLSTGQYEKIFSTLADCFNIELASEISLEANPGSVDKEYLIGLREIGFNRISLGAQSTNEKELQFLGRIHTRDDIFNAVHAARSAGFENINLDLIFGLPGQKLDNWKNSLKEAATLNLEHLSLYALTMEDGTPFGSLVRNGLMNMPDSDLAAEMYEWASDELDRYGFQQYEISNWAKQGRNCVHNLQYWRNLPYLGFGVAAHGFEKKIRISNSLRINDYINRIQPGIIQDTNKLIKEYPISPATVSRKTVSKRTEMQETLMLGLRLTKEGVSSKDFFNRFEEKMIVVFEEEISELLSLNLLEWFDESLRLTNAGRLLGNQVFMRFVD